MKINDNTKLKVRIPKNLYESVKKELAKKKLQENEFMQNEESLNEDLNTQIMNLIGGDSASQAKAAAAMVAAFASIGGLGILIRAIKDSAAGKVKNIGQGIKNTASAIGQAFQNTRNKIGE